MPRKLIEKLTGSVKLTQEELKDIAAPAHATHRPGPSSKKSLNAEAPLLDQTEPLDQDDKIEQSKPAPETDEEDFELPPEEEIETIEEVIEDDSISEEQVEEYYEVIEEEEEEEEEVSDDITAVPLEHISKGMQKEEVAEESTPNQKNSDDYPSFDFHDDYEEEDTEEATAEKPSKKNAFTEFEKEIERAPRAEPTPSLHVDIYELHHELIIRALIPGITPDKLRVSITRTHVTLSGDRTEPDGINEHAYYSKEIPSGKFHRVITLPVEVDVEHAEAVEKYGLLIIRLPMLDSSKSQELKVRSA